LKWVKRIWKLGYRTRTELGIFSKVNKFEGYIVKTKVDWNSKKCNCINAELQWIDGAASR